MCVYIANVYISYYYLPIINLYTRTPTTYLINKLFFVVKVQLLFVPAHVDAELFH